MRVPRVAHPSPPQPHAHPPRQQQHGPPLLHVQWLPETPTRSQRVSQAMAAPAPSHRNPATPVGPTRTETLAPLGVQIGVRGDLAHRGCVTGALGRHAKPQRQVPLSACRRRCRRFWQCQATTTPSIGQPQRRRPARPCVRGISVHVDVAVFARASQDPCYHGGHARL